MAALILGTQRTKSALLVGVDKAPSSTGVLGLDDMRQFEMRFFDKLDVAVLTRVHTANDDFGALTEAERLSATHTIEVWEGGRLVVRVKKRNLPLWGTEN